VKWRRRVRRVGPGQYELALEDTEREALQTLAAWLRDRLAADTTAPDVRRLFPPAYAEDEVREIEYQELMRDELLETHFRQLEVFEETSTAERVDEPQLLAWMTAINSLRLVIGTELDVTDEDDTFDVDPADPEAGLRMTYGALGVLLEEVVEALGD
jgi:hypothetical protein